MEYPKIKREIDKDYLAYIRKQPCLVGLFCRGRVAPHHDPSIGAGGSDYRALPLCANHHTTVHQIGRKSFQDRSMLNFNKERVRLLIGYIKRLR